MSDTRHRPRRGAALVVLIALSMGGCARQGAAPGAGAAAPAAQAAAAPGRPPAAPQAAAVPPGAQTSAASAAPTAAALAAEAPTAPELTLDQLQRRSPSAALVETFNAACAEPSRNAVERAAKRLEFTPVAAEALRDVFGGASAVAVPEDAEAWRGPEEVGGAVLVWNAATSTCELRARGVDLLLVESAFSRLPRTLEEEGSSVMRLATPAAPAGGVRTRQMLLVQPGRFSRPERARVLRLGHHIGGSRGEAGTEAPGDAVTLSARGVSAPR